MIWGPFIWLMFTEYELCFTHCVRCYGEIVLCKTGLLTNNSESLQMKGTEKNFVIP